MDLSTTLSLVQTILTAIQTLGQLQSVCSISNCKSELDDLQNTVETVRAVLMDADAKQDSLNFQEQNYVKELKDAVYDADHVLDEFLTLAKRKRLRRSKAPTSYPKLKRLEINNLEWLKSIPIEYAQFLIEIDIFSDDKLESLGEVKEFPTCLTSSLRFLTIVNCPQLKSVGGWLEHLSALEVLVIEYCPKVELGGTSWRKLARTLQSLHLAGFKEMSEMPEWIQYCTSLRDLQIVDCPKLDFLPKWMPILTSLQKLHLCSCSERLNERCQQNGDDWPLINHISSLTVN